MSFNRCESESYNTALEMALLFIFGWQMQVLQTTKLFRHIHRVVQMHLPDGSVISVRWGPVR